MKHKLISKRLTALALGTILATSPLSVVANAAAYNGQNPLTITINDGASIAEALSLEVTDDTKAPSVTFAGEGSIGGKLTFKGHDLYIKAAAGAGVVDVTEATTVEVAKAESVTVTDADSVVAGSDVTAVEIKGDITDAVEVNGANVTITDGASIGKDLTGTVGELTVDAAEITINAKLTSTVAINADVVLGDKTFVTEDAEITVSNAAVTISSDVKIERTTETSEGTVTTAPLFEADSTITELTTGTSVNLGKATVEDLVIVVIDATAGKAIEVLGEKVENANITIDVTDVNTSDKVVITLPSGVEEVGVVGGTSENLTFKDEDGKDNKIEAVQQAAAPTVTGKDVAFGEVIDVTFDGDYAEAGLSVYYTINGKNPLKSSTINVEEGEEVTGLALADDLTLDKDVFVATTTESATFPNSTSVEIYAVVAQSGLADTAVAQKIKPSKAVELTVSVKDADYSALEDAITEAKELLDETEISEYDGTDVPTTEKWVTKAVVDTLNGAIKTAEDEIATLTATTQDEISGFEDELNGAIETFEKAQQDGKKEETPEGGDGNGDENTDDASTLTHTVEVTETVKDDSVATYIKATDEANAKIVFTAKGGAVDLVAALEPIKAIVAEEFATIEGSDNGIKATNLEWSLTDDISALFTLTKLNSVPAEEKSIIDNTITGDSVTLTYTAADDGTSAVTGQDVTSAVTGQLDAVIYDADGTTKLAFVSIDLEVVAGETGGGDGGSPEDGANYTHEITVTQYVPEQRDTIDDQDDQDDGEASLQLSGVDEGNLIIEVPATGGTIDLKAAITEISDKIAAELESTPEAAPLLATWTLSENDLVKITKYAAGNGELLAVAEADVAEIVTLAIDENETEDDIEVTLTVSYPKDATDEDTDAAELAKSVEETNDDELAKSVEIVITIAGADGEVETNDAPSAENVKAGTDNAAGTIVGVDTDMEYILKSTYESDADDAEWIACTGTTITGENGGVLPDGTYLVRYAATGKDVASETIEIVIKTTVGGGGGSEE